MFDLQIPYWAMTACGGYILGAATIIGLAAGLNRQKQKRVRNALGAIAVEFETEGGESSDDQQLD